MNPFRSALVVALMLFIPHFPSWASDLSTARIDAVTSRPALRRAVWGILVEDAAGHALYERNADTLMTPASARKLFMASSVLACRGSDAVLETVVSITGVRVKNTLRGDLVIRGGGDPSLGGRWEYDSDRMARLRPVVDALRRRGIERIDGDVVVDVSAFDETLIPGGWKSDNIGNAWAAPVDAIAFNENVIGVRVTGRKPASAIVSLDPDFARYSMEELCTQRMHSVGMGEGNEVRIGCSKNGDGVLSYLVSVDDPALFVAAAFRMFLAEEGVSTRGVRATRDGVHDARPLVVIESPPVGMLLSAVLEDSANLYAEMLLKSLSIGDVPASYEESLGIERAYLEGVVGLDEDEFRFDDGSGLSPENAVTPRASIMLLRHIDKDVATRHLIMDAVASPGEGTLRKRLKGLEGKVFAKTGAIDNVNALVGWVEGKKGSLRRFAIFINHHTARGRTAMDAIDDIVRVIAEF